MIVAVQPIKVSFLYLFTFCQRARPLEISILIVVTLHLSYNDSFHFCTTVITILITIIDPCISAIKTNNSLIKALDTDIIININDFTTARPCHYRNSYHYDCCHLRARC